MLVPFLRCRLFGRVLAQSDRPMCRLDPRRSGRGQPHPPCKSTGCRALLRPGAGEPPVAPHPPAPVCGGADAKTKPAVHGGTGKKGDRPGVGAPERSGSCGRNPQIPHSYFTLCRRILQLFHVRKLLWDCRATIHIGQSLHRVWLWGSVRDLLQPKAGVKLPVSRGRFVVDWKREGAKSQHTGTVSDRAMPGGPKRG